MVVVSSVTLCLANRGLQSVMTRYTLIVGMVRKNWESAIYRAYIMWVVKHNVMLYIC